MVFAFLAGAVLGARPLAAGAHALPIWHVSDGPGHQLYLVGSMHALKPDDYPLPVAMKAAFEHSNILVEELDLNSVDQADVLKVTASLGMLPPNETLAGAMGPDWERARELAKTAGVNLDIFTRSKPWLAAVEISAESFRAAGYRATLGLDRHFTALALVRGMPIIGLETVKEQLELLASIPLALQRKFLLQTLADAHEATTELDSLHQAWRAGDTRTLQRIANKDFAHFETLRARLVTDRNERWIKTLVDCLANGKTCFVVVGAEHMIGREGLVALLRARGYRIRQLQSAAAARPTTDDP